MIIGLGIDLIDTPRVERELARGAWAQQDGVFSAAEVLFCDSHKHPSVRYAACFAAKEAALKALSLRVADLGFFREIEVLPGPNHEYSLRLSGRAQSASRALGARNALVSVAATAKLSAAVVVLEA